MPYKDASELPPALRETLSPEAQDYYIMQYNEAWNSLQEGVQHGLSRESIAHQIAWDALNREFIHSQMAGGWTRRSENLNASEEVETKIGNW